MESARYFILSGSLLFIMALTPGLLKKLPITSSVIYLLFGIIIGHHGFDFISLDALRHSKVIELVAELTVIISLFTVGLKLRVKLSDRLWLLPISLATVSMIFTVGLIALVSYQFLDFGLGEAVLLGAMIAPTDPVLASEVQLQHPEEKNSKKFILTSEGGMNDGTAFPFVMLGLGLLGFGDTPWDFKSWALNDLLWPITGGLLIGASTGYLITRVASYVKVLRRSYYLEDFLTISSIALSYGLALQFHAYGFLAVFANALTIRQLEVFQGKEGVPKTHQKLPDDVLTFNEQLESFFEIVSVGIVGLLMDFRTFSWSCVLIPLAVIFIIRPLSVFIGTATSELSLKDKAYLSYFGVRGIGSIYYLYFALNHMGVSTISTELIKYTLWTIFFSILLHGVSIKLIRKNKDSQAFSTTTE